MALRVACLIDGFNLYHSIVDAIRNGAKEESKWLDIQRLCAAQMSIFNDITAYVSAVYYFSTYATYRKDGSIIRHRAYIKALRATNVETVLGHFKDKKVRCQATCRKQYKVHFEKQTDVNIALKLIELFLLDKCDAIILVSGDGDLVPAITTAKRLFPEKKIAIAFPYKRWFSELYKASDIRIQLEPQQYEQFILPNPVKLATKELVYMPKEWYGLLL